MVVKKLIDLLTNNQPISFRQILTRNILIISIVSLSLLGTTSVFISYFNNYRQVAEGLRNSCNLASNTIQIYMNSIIKTINTISPYIAIADNSLEEKRLINKTLNENPETFLELTILNQSGQVQQSTSFSIENMEKPNLSTLFEIAKEKNEVVKSEAFFSQKFHEPCMMVINPIDSRDQQNSYLLAVISLRTIWNLFDENSNMHIAFGDTGYAYLLDSEMKIIAHPSIQKALANVRSEWLPKSLFDDGNDLSLYFDQSGHLVYGFAAFIPSLDWFVVMEITFIELMMSILTTLLIMCCIIVLVFLITLYLSKVFANYMTNDIHQLQKFAAELSSGKLHSKVQTQSNIKEINELSDNFNVMSSQLENTIEKLKLADRLAALGKLSAIVAHEIRNPLAGMKPYVQLFEQRVKNNDQRYIDGFIKVMPSEIDRLEALVNNLLDYTKPIIIEKEPVDINNFIDSIITQLSFVLDEHNIALIKLPEEFHSIFSIDQDKVRQVIINIIMNSVQALKAQKERKITIQLSENHDSHNNWLEIRISDNGPGIPEGIRERLFEPFTKGRSGKGSGLGMSIASRIVEDHGGQLTLNNTSSDGTSISIILYNTEKEKYEKDSHPTGGRS